MPLRHHFFDRLTTEEQERILREIEEVMEAVFKLGPAPDPEQVRKFLVMLKPGDPTELKYVTLEKAT